MTTASFPPGPKGFPLIGDMLAFYREPHTFLLNLAREYGDIAHFRIGPLNAFLINHHDYIQDVLVNNYQNFAKGRILQRLKFLGGEGLITTSDHHYHRRQRRLIQPAFHRQRIAAYGAVMMEYGARIRERWQDGATLDIAQEMMRLTLAIVGKTLFDADIESEAKEIGEAWTIIMEKAPMLLVPFSELLDRFPLPSNRRFRKAKDRLDETIYRMINERRASGVDRSDLLSMLLQARDEEGDGGGMNDEQARDEALTILLAGHETMATSLTWTWYLLSQYPEAEAKLHAELDTVLAGKLPSINDVAHLRYTRMVFAEALRLYPPVWLMGRQALNDYKIDSYVIPVNSLVFISQYVTHHDPRYYPDPFRFDPERWTPEAEDALPRFAYFPFSGGPRQCIGEQFAWTEGVLLIATLAQEWQMRLVPGHPVEPHPLITLRPGHGMRMTLERRKLVTGHQEVRAPLELTNL